MRGLKLNSPLITKGLGYTENNTCIVSKGYGNLVPLVIIVEPPYASLPKYKPAPRVIFVEAEYILKLHDMNVVSLNYSIPKINNINLVTKFSNKLGLSKLNIVSLNELMIHVDSLRSILPLELTALLESMNIVKLDSSSLITKFTGNILYNDESILTINIKEIKNKLSELISNSNLKNKLELLEIVEKLDI